MEFEQSNGNHLRHSPTAAGHHNINTATTVETRDEENQSTNAVMTEEKSSRLEKHKEAAGQSRYTFHRRVVSILFALVMCYYFVGSSPLELFQYHPLTMTIAFVGFMPEIVGLANGLRRQRSAAGRESFLDRHLYYALIMKFLSLIGMVAITVNKEKKGKRHYTTWHGKLGLATMIILMFQVVIGIIYHYRIFAGNPQIIVKLRKTHKYAGVALLAVGCASMWLGMQTHFAERALPNGLVSFVFGIITVVLSVVAYYQE